jgi:hypothetical protein
MGRALPTTRCRHEDGSILIEVMAAAALLVVGVLAVLGVTDAARNTTSTAQRASAAAAVAQREIEAMRTLPFASLFDCGAPPAGTSATQWLGSAGGSVTLRVQEDYRRGDGQILRDVPSTGEPLWGGTCSATAGVQPGPTPFASGTVHGNVYRYVTAVGTQCSPTLSADLNQSLSLAGGANVVAGTTSLALNLTASVSTSLSARVASLCQLGATEAKRLTVAVAVNSQPGGAGPHQPLYFSALVTDPNTGLVSF